MKNNLFSNFLLLSIIVLLCVGCPSDNTSSPSLFLEGQNPVYLTIGDTYLEPGFIAFDDIDGDLSKRVQIQDDNFNIQKEGVYEIRYSVVSRNGTLVETVRTIYIQNNVSSIQLLGENPQVISLGDTWFDFGVAALDIDNSDAYQKVTIDGDSNVDSNVPGRYLVDYQFIDQAGVERIVTREVYVVLEDRPIIILKGLGVKSTSRLKIEKNATGDVVSYLESVDPGYAAYDLIDGNITDSVIVNYDEADVSATGDTLFELTYQVNNSNGKSSEPVVRHCLLAEDATPPVVTLTGSDLIVLECGIDTYTEAGATAADYDRMGALLQDNLTVSRQIDKMEGDVAVLPNMTQEDMVLFPGIYHLVYKTEDGFGNPASAIRIVRVEDSIAPVIIYKGQPVDSQILDEVVIPFGDVLSGVAEDAIATDESSDFSIVVIGDRFASISSRIAGEYFTTFIAEDSSGNRAPKVIRKVTILPPPNAPVYNGGFEDYTPDVGINIALEGQPDEILGWQFNYRAYKKEGTYKQWGAWLNGYSQALYTDAGGQYAIAFVCAHNGDLSETENRRVTMHGGLNGLYTNKALKTDETDIDPLIGLIPIDLENWLSRSMGKLYQEGIFVYKNIDYRADFWLKAVNGRNQTMTIRVKTDRDGMNFGLNGETAITEKNILFNSSSDPNNVWVKKVVYFTPNIDGDIRLEIDKSDVLSGSDGTEIWIDDVSVVPVSFPSKN